MSAAALKAMLANKDEGRKIACITAYDATFSRVAVAAGVDAILVGDSLGMVLHGEDTTLHVRLADMVYHSRISRAGAGTTPLITDIPFASACTTAQAVGSAVRLVQQGRCDMVKLEGGNNHRLQAVRAITTEGIPVCGHLGVLPQSILAKGSYQRLSVDSAVALELPDKAVKLQDAGATMLVLECVPAALAAAITDRLRIPVIGIGAGAACDGQVLVLHDLLGLNPEPPFFSHDFVSAKGGIAAAISDYVQQVRQGIFPGEQHIYGNHAQI